MNLNRELAKLLKSNRITYCADGYVYTEILEEKDIESWSLDKVIKFGNNTFGEPPNEINEAIHNYYFIDSFDLRPKELDLNKKVWSRYIDEHEKKFKEKMKTEF